MKLMLMRHGESGQDAPSDFERCLTPAGRAMVTATGAWLAGQGVERLLVSPYRRTRETAALVAAALSLPEAAMTCSDALVPETPTSEAARAIAEAFRETATGLVVTHQPLISSLLYWLTGEQVPMSPGRLAVLDAPMISTGCCRLLCLH